MGKGGPSLFLSRSLGSGHGGVRWVKVPRTKIKRSYNLGCVDAETGAVSVNGVDVDDLVIKLDDIRDVLESKVKSDANLPIRSKEIRLTVYRCLISATHLLPLIDLMLLILDGSFSRTVALSQRCGFTIDDFTIDELQIGLQICRNKTFVESDQTTPLIDCLCAWNPSLYIAVFAIGMGICGLLVVGSIINFIVNWVRKNAIGGHLGFADVVDLIMGVYKRYYDAIALEIMIPLADFIASGVLLLIVAFAWRDDLKNLLDSFSLLLLVLGSTLSTIAELAEYNVVFLSNFVAGIQRVGFQAHIEETNLVLQEYRVRLDLEHKSDAYLAGLVDVPLPKQLMTKDVYIGRAATVLLALSIVFDGFVFMALAYLQFR